MATAYAALQTGATAVHVILFAFGIAMIMAGLFRSPEARPARLTAS